MKKLLFSFSLVLLAANFNAQQELYALTGKDTPQIVFNDFRSLDFRSGTTSHIILSDQMTPSVYSQVLHTAVKEDKSGIHHSQSQQMASLAYDNTNDQLFYIPLFSSNVYILNNKTGKITLLENTVVKTTPCDINSHLTRMTAGYDGNIYILNNAGSQFIKISNESGRYSVSDLGALKNDPSNGENRLDVMNIGFGGDMVADNENNFYLFSAMGHVFKVFSKDLKAKYLGKIGGLPENYSVNGAAVNEAGNVVIASAKGQPFYEVSLKNLEAKPLDNFVNLHVYDLASKYFAGAGKLAVNPDSSDEVTIAPSNVKEKFFNVKVPKKNGNFTVELFNISGTNVFRQDFRNAAGGTNRIDLKNIESGVYVVTVKDDFQKLLLTKKILVTN